MGRHVADSAISTPWIHKRRPTREYVLKKPSTEIRFATLFSNQATSWGRDRQPLAISSFQRCCMPCTVSIAFQPQIVNARNHVPCEGAVDVKQYCNRVILISERAVGDAMTREPRFSDPGQRAWRSLRAFE